MAIDPSLPLATSDSVSAAEQGNASVSRQVWRGRFATILIETFADGTCKITDLTGTPLDPHPASD